MPRARVFVTHPRQFRIRVANRFVALNHRVDGQGTFGVKLGHIFAGSINFLTELVGCFLVLRILRSGSFALEC